MISFTTKRSVISCDGSGCSGSVSVALTGSALSSVSAISSESPCSCFSSDISCSGASSEILSTTRFPLSMYRSIPSTSSGAKLCKNSSPASMLFRETPYKIYCSLSSSYESDRSVKWFALASFTMKEPSSLVASSKNTVLCSATASVNACCDVPFLKISAS